MQDLDRTWDEATFGTAGTLYKSEAGGDWSYRGTDATAYEDVFDIEAGTEDYAPLTDFLKWLDEASDEEFAEGLEERLDVEAFADYLAFEDLVGNFDDIEGPGNNSFLRWDADAQRMTVVAWDHNLAFGAMAGMERGGGGPGGQPPEGFEPPEGSSPADGELPEGFEPPADGELPEGFEPPADGELPEGFEPPAGGGGSPMGRGNVLVDRFEEVPEFQDALRGVAGASSVRALRQRRGRGRPPGLGRRAHRAGVGPRPREDDPAGGGRRPVLLRRPRSRGVHPSATVTATPGGSHSRTRSAPQEPSVRRRRGRGWRTARGGRRPGRAGSGPWSRSVSTASAPAAKRTGGSSSAASWTRASASLAGSPPCLPSMPCQASTVACGAVGVVLDRRLGVLRGLRREQLGAEEAGLDEHRADAERRDLGGQRLHEALDAELRGGVGGQEVAAGGDAGGRGDRHHQARSAGRASAAGRRG